MSTEVIKDVIEDVRGGVCDNVPTEVIQSFLTLILTSTAVQNTHAKVRTLEISEITRGGGRGGD